MKCCCSRSALGSEVAEVGEGGQCSCLLSHCDQGVHVSASTHKHTHTHSNQSSRVVFDIAPWNMFLFPYMATVVTCFTFLNLVCNLFITLLIFSLVYIAYLFNCPLCLLTYRFCIPAYLLTANIPTVNLLSSTTHRLLHSPHLHYTFIYLPASITDRPNYVTCTMDGPSLIQCAQATAVIVLRVLTTVDLWIQCNGLR